MGFRKVIAFYFKIGKTSLYASENNPRERERESKKLLMQDRDGGELQVWDP